MKTLEWILAAFVAAFLVAVALMSTGCSSAQLRTAQAIDCRLALLEPYLGDLTEDLVRDGLRDPGALVNALINLGLTPEEVMRLGDSWRACAGSPPPPSLPAQAAPTSLESM
jgi:hypothetical protein